MAHITLMISILICMIITVVIGIDIPIQCTPRYGDPTQQIPTSWSTTACNVGETMVSCGIISNGSSTAFGGIGGAHIDTDTCYAYDYSASSTIRAVAHCCEFPPEASVTALSTWSTTSDVSVTCPTGFTLTGCSYSIQTSTDSKNRVVHIQSNKTEGSYSGNEPPPQQTTDMLAIARCITTGDARYKLACETKANLANFGSCETGNMMGCNAFDANGNLEQFLVDTNDECRVQSNDNDQLYASAICCRMVFTTSTTTEDYVILFMYCLLVAYIIELFCAYYAIECLLSQQHSILLTLIYTLLFSQL